MRLVLLIAFFLLISNVRGQNFSIGTEGPTDSIKVSIQDYTDFLKGLTELKYCEERIAVCKEERDTLKSIVRIKHQELKFKDEIISTKDDEIQLYIVQINELKSRETELKTIIKYGIISIPIVGTLGIIGGIFLAK